MHLNSTLNPPIVAGGPSPRCAMLLAKDEKRISQSKAERVDGHWKQAQALYPSLCGVEEGADDQGTMDFGNRAGWDKE